MYLFSLNSELFMKNDKNQKLPSIQKVLGEMGEHFVQRHLSSHSDSYTRADGINFLAEHLLREDLKEDFDYSADAIRALTDRCRSSSKCVRFDANERPCLKDEFYEKNYNFDLGMDEHDTGDNKFRYYCADKLSKLEIMSYLEEFSPRNQFILDYLITSFFIDKYYQSDSLAREAAGKDYSNMSELEKKEWSKYWNGIPGRLDFFAKKNGKYYCIDAKVNSSKLSLWQHVRMNWMMKCGHISQIYNVKIKYPDKEELIKTYAKYGVNSALELASPELQIIEYDYSMSDEAEKLVSDRESFLNIAQMTLPWDDWVDKNMYSTN